MLLALVVGLVAVPVTSASAATYTSFRDVAAVPNANRATTTEGFAAGSRYLYSVKIKDNERAVIYRVDKSSGARKLMTNRANGTTSVKGLWHANDMTLVTIGGRQYLYVVTMKPTGAQLVKLRLRGASYEKVGRFKLRDSAGAVVPAHAVNVVAVSPSRIKFFFASVDQFYRGTIKPGASSGTIALTAAFTVDLANPVGERLPGVTNRQGIYYDKTRSDLYVPLTGGNTSVVLVFHGVTWKTTGRRRAAAKPYFKVVSKDRLFEIEGVGLSGDRLYFNTNRPHNRDGIHVFTRFRA
ncbi:MAG: hypothetical protein J7518_10130 [Nocardioidaceae bacterium]|nr:hypothetical protein [Nocardioidaceae bacterium]